MREAAAEEALINAIAEMRKDAEGIGRKTDDPTCAGCGGARASFVDCAGDGVSVKEEGEGQSGEACADDGDVVVIAGRLSVRHCCWNGRLGGEAHAREMSQHDLLQLAEGLNALSYANPHLIKNFKKRETEGGLRRQLFYRPHDGSHGQ